MSLAPRALMRAARLGAHIRAAEAELRDAIAEAKRHGLDDLADGLRERLCELETAHGNLSAFADIVASATGASPADLRSGGDGDKPEDPPPSPPPPPGP